MESSSHNTQNPKARIPMEIWKSKWHLGQKDIPLKCNKTAQRWYKRISWNVDDQRKKGGEKGRPGKIWFV